MAGFDVYRITLTGSDRRFSLRDIAGLAGLPSFIASGLWMFFRSVMVNTVPSPSSASS